MLKALFNDFAQRLLTFNKTCQRAFLREFVLPMGHPRGSLALDFGCGTGLFVPTLAGLGYACHGLDIDPELTSFASRLYPHASFHQTPDHLPQGQFSLILANCCFHHIPDGEIRQLIASWKALLTPGGRIVVIDILAKSPPLGAADAFLLRIEQGKHLRSAERLLALVSDCLSVVRETRVRTSILWPGCSMGYDMLAMELVP